MNRLNIRKHFPSKSSYNHNHPLNHVFFGASTLGLASRAVGFEIRHGYPRLRSDSCASGGRNLEPLSGFEGFQGSLLVRV